MERLGEVPVAVIEKAKTCGGHNLSGAVMRPGPLEELFPDMSREEWRKEGFAFGEVTKEAVYMLPNGKTQLRIPPPPPFKNHGNEVISVSALARYQQRHGRGGRRLHPHRDRRRRSCSSRTASCAACAPATRAAARTASRSATSSPAPTSRRRRPCSPRAAGAT